MSTHIVHVDASQPTTARLRIPSLDVVRGFAVVGLLFSTMPFYSAPTYHTGFMASTDSLSGLAVLAMQFFLQGKVDALFAFLFGLGITMQLTRRDANGGTPQRLLVRRLLVLAIIGVLHVSLLFYGDVLFYYAILGLTLLAVWRLPSKALLTLAVFCVMFPALFGLVKIRFHFPTPQSVQRPVSAAPHSDRRGLPAQQAARQAAQESVRIYSTGSFTEVAAQRWNDVVIRVVPAAIALPHIFAMLLFGAYVGRRGVTLELDAQRAWMRRVFWWSLVTGVIVNVISVGLRLVVRPQMMPPWLLVPAQATFYLGGPVLACAYASGIVLLLGRGGRVASWLLALAPAGRMAVTNYLLQSLVCTTLFYGYGFGLYGKLDAVAMVGLAAIIVAAEVVLSRAWLRRFSFGPVEWLWRFAAYGRSPAIERPAAVSA